MAPKKDKTKKTYDYSGIEKGMRVQAESDGVFYAAEVLQVSTSKNRQKAPVKISFKGYEGYDIWVGGDRLRSKALKVVTGSPAKTSATPLPDGVETVAVITGGGSGIGKALALALSAAGHSVVIVGRRQEVLSNVAAEAPEKIFPCPADVGTPSGRKGIAAFVGKRPVSVLVHNAAVCDFAALSSMALESFQSAMHVNVEGPVFLTQALLGNLKACKDKARVLMISSGAADLALPTMGGYCMTKAAMKMSWMALRDELKEDVAIGYCIPGLVATEITDKQLKDPGFALKDFIAGRVQAGDIHPAAEAAEWMAALLDAKLCNDETFAQQEHNIDKAEHQLGVKVTLTMEAKLLQGTA